ncbi:maleylpyruvate isomerase family mycothiol-dependent enzyme [Nocardia sp. NPDC052566]|uniref:maleylpyruvate isomerase family mycothiol-dependent enzyme n=1 Tax=Nocardia sp. NPDC052566 TaxID=3364330 RepID=UPI0037C7A7F3
MSEHTMTTEQIWQAVAAERASLADLLAPLPESDWDRASLCAGWRIRDVVAHLILPTQPKIGTIVVALIRARGNLDRFIADTAIRHAGQRTPRQLLAELRASVGSRVTVVGTTPADRLMDLLVHGQDIAVPLGLTREMPIAATRSAIERVWTMGTPFHARKKFSGYRLVATDTDWTAGDGPTIEGPAAALLMLLTGRTAAHAQLTGDGVARLIAKGD